MDEALRTLQQARTLGPTGQGRHIREGARLSLSEVAAVLGVDPSTLARWERGLARPRGAAARRWVDLVEELAARVNVGGAAP